MKIYKSTIYILLYLLLVSSSCDDFFDVNDTPNNPLSVPPEVILPSVLTGAAFANANELNRFGSTIMNYMAGAGGGPGAYDIYNVDGSDFNNQWEGEIYGGALINGKELIKSAEAVGSNAYIGIAKIMMAYTTALATDLWGDIPYSESLDPEVPQPRYDTQRDIYLGNESLGIQSLFDLIREGLADLDKTSTSKPGTEDIAYGGELDEWKRAGNTLMLKLAMQISAVEPGIATQVINEVFTGNNFIISNDQDLNVKFGSSVGSQSPIYTYTRVSIFQDNMIMSETILNELNARNDPRLDVFFTNPSGSYVTIQNGFNGTLPDAEDFSRYDSYVVGEQGEGPVRLLTNFQRAFIFAEAALTLTGFSDAGAGRAQFYYDQGIRASMELAGFETAAIDTYLAANPDVALLNADPEEALKQIITQKWIAWTGNGLEAYNDWRRTGYPELPESLNAQGVDGTRPVRVVYSNEEIAANPKGPGVIQSNVKVWWDVD
ncbi:SusD/RagB family nutrient-binding outer membrane lipoprotein [Fulvivirga sp. M361]|uniref:SusD/RagB family nutrient-binding outer membrane lipoprotein n=1 Tax=Fulvivirga sp. M361 TaxID=2594266 RepID=UPI00117998B0|nr:SusD/RagB family nutrient-binding outer membrane lipoprotein [Fulvivirga sp. M361]TRX60806.1 SusD/RagB family nutrient-binding outer membrane lipoprotein [Fulvivirga sp. M361]